MYEWPKWPMAIMCTCKHTAGTRKGRLPWRKSSYPGFCNRPMSRPMEKQHFAPAHAQAHARASVPGRASPAHHHLFRRVQIPVPILAPPAPGLHSPRLGRTRSSSQVGPAHSMLPTSRLWQQARGRATVGAWQLQGAASHMLPTVPLPAQPQVSRSGRPGGAGSAPTPMSHCGAMMNVSLGGGFQPAGCGPSMSSYLCPLSSSRNCQTSEGGMRGGWEIWQGHVVAAGPLCISLCRTREALDCKAAHGSQRMQLLQRILAIHEVATQQARGRRDASP
jgi:hypothetical protein